MLNAYHKKKKCMEMLDIFFIDKPEVDEISFEWNID